MNHLRPGVDAELEEDASQVAANRPLADLQALGNQLVGVSRGNQLNDFQLPGRQMVFRKTRTSLGHGLIQLNQPQALATSREGGHKALHGLIIWCRSILRQHAEGLSVDRELVNQLADLMVGARWRWGWRWGWRC
jgi:hypothetical protein